MRTTSTDTTKEPRYSGPLGMAKRRLLLLLLVSAFVAAPVALTCTPSAYMTLDGPNRPSPDRPFSPGDTVTVSGFLFDPAAATPVRLSWGPNGAVIAETAVSEKGTWEVTFQIPAETATGSYLLYAIAYAANGSVINGLPARVLLPVKAPAPPADEPQREPETPGVTDEPAPVPEATEEPRGEADAASAPQAATRSAPVAPVAEAPMTPQATPVPETAIATDRPARTNVIRFAPAPRLIEAPLPPVAAPSSAPALPVVDEASDGVLPWWLLALGAVGLLLLGGAAGMLVRGRERTPEPPAPTPADTLEAELQELIAEERARRVERVNEPVEHR